MSESRDFVLDFLAVIVITGFFLMASLIIFVDVPSDKDQILYMMLGQLSSGFIIVLMHYFKKSMM